jgi:hypothetical protein
MTYLYKYYYRKLKFIIQKYYHLLLSYHIISINSKMPYGSKFENISGVTERKTIKYTPDELKGFKEAKEDIDLQFKKLSRNKETRVYENQTKIAKQILNNFTSTSIVNEMVISPTQSGKTGIICETIRYFISDTDIPYKNIYIITGLSSVEWKVQTKNRLPEKIAERVYHRNDLLESFKSDIRRKKNVLIILDEIQIASSKDQTIHKVFNELGYMDIKKVLENDIKLIEITATPNGSIYSLMKWGDKYSNKIIVEPPSQYTSCFKLYEQNRVKQYADLCDSVGAIENVEELKETINSTYKTPRYHLIRTKPSELQELTKNNFKKVFGENCKIIEFDFKSDNDDINDIVKDEPSDHTFIFVKEKLRCAKTIENKQLMGVYYERFTESRAEDDVIIQGMLGRATGYNDNGDTIIYTNVDSIEKYQELIKSHFDDMSINWVSSSTVMKNKKIRSKNYYFTPENIQGFKAIEFENDNETPEERRARIEEQKKEKELRKLERERVKEEKQKIREQKQREKEEKKEEKKKAKEEKEREKQLLKEQKKP